MGKAAFILRDILLVIHILFGHSKQLIMKILLLFIFFSILNISCFKQAENLTLSKREYYGSLKMNGYYFTSWENKGGNDVAFFLYKNGLMFDFGGVGYDLNMNLLTKDQVRDSSIRYIMNLYPNRSLQYDWGLFNIDSNQIVAEKWLTNPGGSYRVGQYVGEIVNDSTLLLPMTYTYPPEGNEPKRIFRFRQFLPKPDSTNNFIK